MTEQGPAPAPRRRRGGSGEAPAEPSKYAETTQLPPIALGAAGGVALLGVLAWGLLISGTGYEIGWLAWGIGAAIGYACRQMGGRGMGAAVLCGVLALVSIFGGKLFGASQRIEEEREKIEAVLSTMDDAALREVYDELVEDARLVQDAHTDDELRRFMRDRGYEDDDGSVSLGPFKSKTLLHLNEIHRDKPSFEEWRDRGGPMDMVNMALPTAPELVKEDLGGVDLLFVALGVGSAFTLAGRGGAGRRPSRRRGRHIEPPPSDPEEPGEPRPPPLPNA